MRITEMLDALKKQPPSASNDTIKANIAKIKELCDQQYSAKRTYGEVALNRMILLDEDIAECLTPEVLTFLFTNEPTENEKTDRDGITRDIRDVIYYGFINGLLPIKHLPNNEPYYGLEEHQKKGEKFENNTLSIAKNIAQASGFKESELEPLDETELYKTSLNQQFNTITTVIQDISANDADSKELIKVPGFTAGAIKQQARQGFTKLTKNIQSELTENNQKITLDNFCELFLRDSKFLLDPDVGHFILDRVHMQAAILSNGQITLGEQKHSYQEVLRKMVEKISENPDKYPIAKQQFFLRLSMVKNDLIDRFNKNDPTFRLTQEILHSAAKPLLTNNAHPAFETLLKQVPVSEIYKAIESSSEKSTVKNDYKKELLNYQLDHLKEIPSWQNGIHSKVNLVNDDIPQPVKNSTEKDILRGIQYLIKDTKWDIGFLGGVKITTDNNTINTIPHGMDNILKVIDKAQKGEVTWEETFKNVQDSVDTSLNKTSFINTRGETTQAFYERAKSLMNELREEGRKEKNALEPNEEHQTNIAKFN